MVTMCHYVLILASSQQQSHHVVTIPTIFPAYFLILLVFQIHGDITHKSRETGPVISPLIDSYHISLSHLLFPIYHDNCMI